MPVIGDMAREVCGNFESIGAQPYGRATGIAAAENIGFAVSNHPGSSKIDRMLLGRATQEEGRRLATLATFIGRVGTEIRGSNLDTLFMH